jgi:hypothetical protein
MFPLEENDLSENFKDEQVSVITYEGLTIDLCQR